MHDELHLHKLRQATTRRGNSSPESEPQKGLVQAFPGKDLPTERHGRRRSKIKKAKLFGLRASLQTKATARARSSSSSVRTVVRIVMLQHLVLISEIRKRTQFIQTDSSDFCFSFF